ncbi:MAG: type I-E CRISPR-associated protein Cse1/CasA [Caldilineaceae bacterium]|nr:type I-E CRISPR-associated protein Cse1/CasA [Caldilineaceae bacterium]
MSNNLLVDPIIRTATSSGPLVHATLPETYALLMRDEVLTFPALRPHQRHAWHAFLAQLGALALRKADRREPPEDAEEWLPLIRGLTPAFEKDEPWRLVVDDITRPAFMQPPASSPDRLKDYKTAVPTPDGLDMLVLSKNHDIKASVAARAEADDWILALVTLQTMEGFGGAGNYGISRMNGGLGSRAAFSLTPSTRPGAHLRRDMAGLLEAHVALLAVYPMSEAGDALLWTLPWDGTKDEALLLNQLNPYYIEVCRRIRLRFDAGGHLHSLRTSSKAARIEAKNLNGVTGDPWMPVNRKESKALTLPRGGFTYKRVIEYLTSGNWDQPALLQPTRAEDSSPAPALLLARGLVRGQGKTEGYHERVIPINARVKRAILRRVSMDELGRIAQERIENISTLQRILSHAIQVFAARGDSDKVSEEHRRLARPWLNRLDEFVDARFFDALQAEFESDDRDEQSRIRKAWLLNGEGGAINRARAILQQAMDALPCPAIHRYRARANAEGLFEGRIRGPQGLAFVFDEPNQGDEE